MPLSGLQLEPPSTVPETEPPPLSVALIPEVV